VRRVRAGRLRWENVPIPEPHIVGLLAAALLELVSPWPLTALEWLAWSVGGLLMAVGATVVIWAVQTAGDDAVSDPSSLVTHGPYRYSRNPMYVGWTGLYLGVTAVVNTAWPVVLLPVVALAVHVVVRREERALVDRFGAEYRRYRSEVRRYL
jgi:protein-S-isoprenylcysteine O-methyltransferase Ste14